MLKCCTKCKIEQPVTNFSFKNTTKGTLASNCKKCQKIMKDKHYIKNQKYYINRNRERRKKKRQWWAELKKELFCVKCGNNHPAVLDYHHRDYTQKEFTLSAWYQNYSEERVLEELAKCEVLCSNCHRILHWEIRNMDHSSNG